MTRSNSMIDNVEKIKQETSKKRTAAKILDSMEQLRQSNNKNNSQRWIWELIQNAKDVKAENNLLNILINLDKKTKVLEFEHNGVPFNLSQIVSLIEQVSSKDREIVNKKVTGKFGTGFLTTHLLSEKVRVESYLIDENNPDCYRKLSINLDRSSSTIPGILLAIEKSYEELYSIENVSEMLTLEKSEYSTKYTYELDEEGVIVAEKGLKQLSLCINYTMAFLDDIHSIKLKHSGLEYINNGVTGKASSHDIDIRSVTKIKNNNSQKKFLFLLRNEEVSIAFPFRIDNNNIFLELIENDTPRLFCDFPLGDTKDFPFSGIINSSSFFPNEPREGIFLVKKDNDKVKKIER